MLIVDFPGIGDPVAPRTPKAIGDGDGSSRLVFEHPIDLLIARTEAEVRPVLRAVEAATGRGLTAVGFVSYEAAPAFDPAHIVAPRRNSDPAGSLPLAWFGLYREPVILPRSRGPRREVAPIDTAMPSLRAAIGSQNSSTA